MNHKISKIIRSPSAWLSLFLAVNLIIGLLTLSGYGESWDEYNFFQYAEESLAAYPGLFQPGFHLTFSDPTLRHYGAWFLMLCVSVAHLFPNIYVSDVAHFLTFLVFQGGIVLMYALSRRWLGAWTSLGVALLYATQPVFYGHAFINARDIPFQVGFIATIYFGLRMNDRLSSLPTTQTAPKVYPSQISASPKIGDNTSKPGKIKISPIALVLILLGAIGFGLLAVKLAAAWLEAVPLLADTSGARAIDLYLRPVLAKFWAGIIFVVLTMVWSGLLIFPFQPQLRAQFLEVELRPYARQLRQLLRSPTFWLASMSLALTMGTRIMGIMAAGLVVIHAFTRIKREAFLPVVAYGLVSVVFLYPTWPYLWGEPLLRLLITFRLMTSFPWPGKVLFGGVYYAGNELPRSYLPTLFSIQLTEPLLMLLFVGLLIAAWKLAQRRAPLEMLWLSLTWFGLPLGAAIFGRPYLYDNFRQMLFILPPLFLVAGLGLDALLERLRCPWAQVALLVFVILPGVAGIVSLYPYPYVYYNRLVGGTSGAFRQYEMDYWGTSFREVAEFLNQKADLGAEVLVWGPPTTIWRYTRPDILIYNSQQAHQPGGAFYALANTRNDADLDVYPSAPIVYQVKKGGAILAVLRYIEP